jgi:hypothetical protein
LDIAPGFCCGFLFVGGEVFLSFMIL